MMCLRVLIIYLIIGFFPLCQILATNEVFIESLHSKNLNSIFECFDKKKLELIKLIPLLVEREFNFDETIDGETILHKAISSAKFYEGCSLWKDYIKALETLIHLGANINTKFENKTPIELAVDLFLIRKWDENKYTINGLHLAQMLEPFLLAGFDPHSIYKIEPFHKNEISFFDIFERYDYNEVTDLIIGDNTLTREGDAFLNWDLSTLRKKLYHGWLDFRNSSLLAIRPYVSNHKMQRNRCQAIAMIFLENGLEPTGINAIDNMKNTPLHDAAYLGNKEVIDLLIKNGAAIDLETKNAEGFTPLMCAAFSKQAESFSCLVHYGADLNVIHKFTHGWTLKQYIRNGQFKDFFNNLRNVYRGMETIQLLMY